MPFLSPVQNHSLENAIQLGTDLRLRLIESRTVQGRAASRYRPIGSKLMVVFAASHTVGTCLAGS